MSNEAYWKGKFRSRKIFEKSWKLTALGAKTSPILCPLNSWFWLLLSHFLAFFQKIKNHGCILKIWASIFWFFEKRLRNDWVITKNMNLEVVKLRTFLPLTRSIFNFFQKSFLIWILLKNTLHLIYWKPKSENVIFSTLLKAEKVKALYEFWRKRIFSSKFHFL